MSNNQGTQSPPVENTAPTDPIGKADKAGGAGPGGASDASQRKGYFGGSGDGKQQASGGDAIERAQQAALESLGAYYEKWHRTVNKAQQYQ